MVLLWRCRSRNNFVTIEEAFIDSTLPTTLGPPPLWGSGSIPDMRADVCGFLKPLGSDRFWKVRMYGAFFSIPRRTLGLRPTDQSCRHVTWLHLNFVVWSNTWSSQDAYEPRISLKERPAEGAYGNPKRRTSEIKSDHSLSAQMCDHSHMAFFS